MGLKKFAKSIAGPLIGLAGDLLGGHSAKKAQKKANEQNIALQREQQAWEERMANTSWQRGTQDMLKAGLNPMLAYSQGGANTPNVSAATVQAEDAEGRALQGAGRGFADRLIQAAQIQQLRATTAKTEAETAATNLDSRIRAWDELYAAGNSANKAGTIAANAKEAEQNAEAAIQKVKNLKLEWDRGKQDLDQRRAIQQAAIEAQQAITQGLQYELPEKRTTAEWYNNNPLAGGSRYVQMMNDLRMLLKK